MRTSWMWIVGLGLGTAFAFGMATDVTTPASAQDAQTDVSAGDADQPPSLVYGSPRSSKAWIEKPKGGGRVAIDDGVTWKGVRVHLSLLWDLVGIDAKTNKVLYAVDVGAFWNAIGFKKVTPIGGMEAWAIELRPGPRNRAGKDKRQYHDLKTGAKLDVPTARPDLGTPFKPHAQYAGDQSWIAKPFFAVVSTSDNWRKLHAMWLAAEAASVKGAPPLDGIDFTKNVALVVSSGNAWNCSGLLCAGAYEDGARILVRLDRRTFQTMGGAHKGRPYCVVVLPKRDAKAYVVEIDKQNLIGGPKLWRPMHRLDGLQPVADQLKGVPAATTTSHHGWDASDE